MDGPRLVECWWVGRVDPSPGGNSTEDGADPAAASALLAYDPFHRKPQAGTLSGHHIVDRLRSAMTEIAPAAALFLALPDDHVALIEALVMAGAVRVDPTAWEAPLLADLGDTLAKGWPVDRTASEVNLPSEHAPRPTRTPQPVRGRSPVLPALDGAGQAQDC